MTAVVGTVTLGNRTADVHDLDACLTRGSDEVCSDSNPVFGLGTRELGASAGTERVARLYSGTDIASGGVYDAVGEYRGTSRGDVRLTTLSLTGG